MYIEYCLWAQVAVLDIYILHILDCLGQVNAGICRFCNWVELPVQRRLCPIFVKNVGSPDIHEGFRGLTGSQRTPGFGASHNSLHAFIPITNCICRMRSRLLKIARIILLHQ